MKKYGLHLTRRNGYKVFSYTRLVNEANLKEEIISHIKLGYIIESIQEL